MARKGQGILRFPEQYHVVTRFSTRTVERRPQRSAPPGPDSDAREKPGPSV